MTDKEERILGLKDCENCPHYDYDLGRKGPKVQCDLQGYKWRYGKSEEVLFPKCPLPLAPKHTDNDCPCPRGLEGCIDCRRELKNRLEARIKELVEQIEIANEAVTCQQDQVKRLRDRIKELEANMPRTDDYPLFLLWINHFQREHYPEQYEKMKIMEEAKQ
jgi:hypothetical protein